MGKALNLPILGSVDPTSLALLGIAGLMGFVLGSSIRQAIKIIIILASAFVIFCAFKPDAIQSLISLASAVKPLLSEFQSSFLGANATPTMMVFGVGFLLGAWKG
jgi:uncharacterized membrane protein (Fun14 family)